MILIMDTGLKGQTALVTGASSGIGQAIAIELGKVGVFVGINFHEDEKGANSTEDEIKSGGGKCICLKADISKESDVFTMYEKLFDHFGTIDILINNSGIQQDSKISEMSLEKWQAVINTNLTGHFLCTREAVKEFLKRGINKNKSVSAGKIVFISSVHDIIPWAGHSNYAASKGGLSMFMRTVALELASEKIRVNSISPGAIKTNINQDAWNTIEAEQKLLKLIPYKRVGIPEDIAKVARWLVSDDAEYITGETIYVDGGMTLYPGFIHGG
jgi:glucose 1-dehydrogenase